MPEWWSANTGVLTCSKLFANNVVLLLLLLLLLVLLVVVVVVVLLVVVVVAAVLTDALPAAGGAGRQLTQRGTARCWRRGFGRAGSIFFFSSSLFWKAELAGPFTAPMMMMSCLFDDCHTRATLGP